MDEARKAVQLFIEEDFNKALYSMQKCSSGYGPQGKPIAALQMKLYL